MTGWKRTGPDQWRSTDGRLQIDRTPLRTTPRRIDAYGITLDGRDTCHASLTLASAQRFADRLVTETTPLTAATIQTADRGKP